MKTLVLAEKPSVGRDLAKVLKCNRKSKGYMEGNKYVVTWAMGHLVTLAEPDDYDKKYKQWKMEQLPMLPEKMKLKIIRKTGFQFKTVNHLMKRNDISELVIATDAGREGELVARWIMKLCSWKKPFRRLWISSQTDKAIREGFSNLKPGRLYDNLYNAAVSRSEADWIVGLNVTRALTCKYNAQLSAGRVQTPTLSMIVQREKEINKFVPKDYYMIVGNVKGFEVKWYDKNKQNRIFDKDAAYQLMKNVSNQTGEIIEVKKEQKKTFSPLLYDLTELQRDANKIYGFSAKKTLTLMQRLYENHKLLTYPRTDSRYLTTDIVPTLKERLTSISIGCYSKYTKKILRDGIKSNKRFVNNAKVSDHHAIIPTEQFVDLSLLTSDERKIYDLVIKRFIAVLFPPYEYEQINITIRVCGENFMANGQTVKSEGWKQVYEYDNEQANKIPDGIEKGQKVKLTYVKVVNDKTKPPARYTEATLLSAMEHPGKFIEDNRLRETINKTGGLGTVATRADIIEKLFNSFYIEKEGKGIRPTSKGIQLIDLVPEDLKLPELTAKWEQELELISKGKLNGKKFTNEMRKYASKLVSDVKASSQTFTHDNITREKCPKCGKYLLEVNNKKGKMLVCEDRQCNYRRMVSSFTQIRCPQCHKKLEIKGEGEGRILVCATCSYHEKLSTYNKRKKGEKRSIDKRQVKRYLKNQNSDKSINTALADALAKLKE